MPEPKHTIVEEGVAYHYDGQGGVKADMSAVSTERILGVAIGMLEAKERAEDHKAIALRLLRYLHWRAQRSAHA